MLTISQAPRRIASAAARAEVIDSSRQTGVRMIFASAGVAEDVLLVQRLLDQQQVERVELGQVPCVARV